ncbi:universal stress protein [Polyangium sp. y55x31]|uniref:universal stress protein n=1 Tax=Polyangium sp. y55x31 TaxID=3042688 RepID=UPI002482867F|nr:universal stress protein [Polyangium sp. y55x31]MDI1478248.1 universal stress protein [Polyangium sp. y55x31]
MKPADLAEAMSHGVERGAEEGPRSEARPKRQRVLVALNSADAAASHAAIAMGRLVARTLHEPLHGIFVSETKVAPGELSRLLGLSPHALDGVVLDVEAGDPVERIVAFTEAHPTAFVIVGAENRERGGLGVGELAAHTIERSHAPVIVVRPEERVSLARILVPLDGTPSTASALEPAGDLARRAGASLDIVLVGEAQHGPHLEPGAMGAPQYVDQPHHEWPAFSAEFVHRFLKTIGHCPEAVPTRFFLGAGAPADEILRFADTLGVDLTVLVWHGLRSEEHGAVFERVLRKATCPVLVLRCC